MSESTAGSDAPTPDPDAVRERLDRVTDPELDESIVALDYVDRVDIDGRRVHVAVTLPTAWCSPAFAWMMLGDARDEVGDLSGVREVTLELCDHMHGEEITRGVNEERSFGEVFPDADGGVAEVRATLDEKAVVARQHEAVGACLEAGLDPEQIVALRRRDVDPAHGESAVSVTVDGLNVVVDGEPVREYLSKARETGRVADADDRLFYTPDGDPISVDRFDRVRKRTRLAGVNMGGQGAVCDALNEARRAPSERD